MNRLTPGEKGKEAERGHGVIPFSALLLSSMFPLQSSRHAEIQNSELKIETFPWGVGGNSKLKIQNS
jgi:hypothetical protein